MRTMTRAAVFAGEVILIAVGAMLIVIALCSCAHAPAPLVVTHTVTVPVKVRCSTNPPPVFKSVPRPTSCVAGMLCFKLADGATLADNIERLKEWVASEWALCAPDAPVSK